MDKEEVVRVVESPADAAGKLVEVLGMVYERPDYSKIKKYSRAKAERDGCVDCYGGQEKGEESPRNCPDYGCPHWRYRMGCSPAEAEKRGIDMRGLR